MRHFSARANSAAGGRKETFRNRNYIVYVSTDGGEYRLWLDVASSTSGVFQGEFGSTYSFYTVASDNVGNTEEAPTAPDAETTVGAAVGPLDIELNVHAGLFGV